MKPPASAAPLRGSIPQEHIFRPCGENEYSLEILPAGIIFYVSRLRRSSHELWGELSVSLTNGHFPKASVIGNGMLSAADMNFSSAQARVTRAKMLQTRCGPEGEHYDWTGFLEELAIKSIEAERQGDPAVALADVPKLADDRDSWEVDDFPVLKRHPTVLFGLGAAGKSYFAMWIAGHLADQGVPVLYLDWELAGDEHRARLERLFDPMPRGIHYLRCLHPLRDQMDRLRRVIAATRARYIVFDSVGPASRAGGGRFHDGADPGQEYFGLVRTLGLGSLHVAHPPKMREGDNGKVTIYGSAFFDYLARSIWFVEAASNAPKGTVVMGLYHHKMTTGAKSAPRAYRLVFTEDRTQVERCDIKTVDELAAKLPLVDRLVAKLEHGSMSVKDLATQLEVPQVAIRKTVTRYPSTFAKFEKGVVGLVADSEAF